MVYSRVLAFYLTGAFAMTGALASSCGQDGQPCCASPAKCCSSLHTLDPSSSLCKPCGAAGQLACTDTDTTSYGTPCTEGHTQPCPHNGMCVPCGGAGQTVCSPCDEAAYATPCAHGHSQPSPTTGMCELCGGPGQTACKPADEANFAAACSPGAFESAGMCVGCGTCGANAACASPSTCACTGGYSDANGDGTGSDPDGCEAEACATILSEGFEDPDVGTGSQTGADPVGWVQGSAHPQYFSVVDNGYNAGGNAYINTPFGTQYLEVYKGVADGGWTLPGTITETLQAASYKLTFNVATGKNNYNWAGQGDYLATVESPLGTVVGTVSGSVTSQDFSQEVGLDITIPAGHGSIGQGIHVRLRHNPVGSNWQYKPVYDNVKLVRGTGSATCGAPPPPPPPPATSTCDHTVDTCFVGCTESCGPQASCSSDASCGCFEGWSDLNGDGTGSDADGCEQGLCLTVLSDGFENPNVDGSANHGSDPVGWTQDAVHPQYFSVIDNSYNNGGNGYISTPFGDQYAEVYNGATAKGGWTLPGTITETLKAATYKLSFNVATGKNNYNWAGQGDYTVTVEAPLGTVVGTVSGSVTTQDFSESVEHTFSVPSTHASVGQSVSVRINHTPGSAWQHKPVFDNLKLAQGLGEHNCNAPPGPNTNACLVDTSELACADFGSESDFVARNDASAHAVFENTLPINAAQLVISNLPWDPRLTIPEQPSSGCIFSQASPAVVPSATMFDAPCTTILSEGFEDPDVGPATQSGADPVGWAQDAVHPQYFSVVDNGYNAGGNGPILTPFGNQYAEVYNGATAKGGWTVPGKITANLAAKTYTLTFNVACGTGAYTWSGTGAYTVTVEAPVGTVVATVSGTTTTQDFSTAVSHSFDVPVGHASIGQPMSLRINHTPGSPWQHKPVFDNIELGECDTPIDLICTANQVAACSDSASGSAVASLRYSMEAVVAMLDDAGRLRMYYHRIAPNPITGAGIELLWMAQNACVLYVDVQFSCTGGDCVEVTTIVCASFAGITNLNKGALRIECKVPGGFDISPTVPSLPPQPGSPVQDATLTVAESPNLFTLDSASNALAPTKNFAGNFAAWTYLSDVDLQPGAPVAGTVTLAGSTSAAGLAGWTPVQDIYVADYNLTLASPILESLIMPVAVHFYSDPTSTGLADLPSDAFPASLSGSPFLSRQTIENGAINSNVNAFIRVVSKVAAASHWFKDLHISQVKKDGNPDATLKSTCHTDPANPTASNTDILEATNPHDGNGYPYATIRCLGFIADSTEDATPNVAAGNTVVLSLKWKLRNTQTSGKAVLLQQADGADPADQSVDVELTIQIAGEAISVTVGAGDPAGSAGGIATTYIIIAVVVIAVALAVTAAVVGYLCVRRKSASDADGVMPVDYSPAKAVVAAVYDTKAYNTNEPIDV